MADTTNEEARRCPKCEQPGVQAAKPPDRERNGTQHITYVCMNERCKWYTQPCRVVTIRPDGTIPAPKTHRAKSFPSLGIDRTEAVRESIDRQLSAEGRRDSEIRR